MKLARALPLLAATVLLLEALAVLAATPSSRQAAPGRSDPECRWDAPELIGLRV